MKSYKIVYCFMSECCDKPHLWVETVRAETVRKAYAKLMRQAKREGRDVFEIVQVADKAVNVREVENWRVQS